MERTFDRLVQFDERSRRFRAVEGIEDLPFRSYTWPCKTWLDQGPDGACVGFAISHELAAIPYAYPVSDDFARLLYHRAQQLDPWEGESYSGTSVLAGMKAVQELHNKKGEKLISEYRWAFGLEDLIRAIGRKGPAVIGCDWWTGMFDTDADGYIHVTGSIAGGHAIMARGVRIRYRKDVPLVPNRMDSVDMDKSYITLHNSWSKEWGLDGTCKISLTDMDRLLKEDGEAVIPVVRSR
jgi:hypothetical protein